MYLLEEIAIFSTILRQEAIMERHITKYQVAQQEKDGIRRMEMRSMTKREEYREYIEKKLYDEFEEKEINRERCFLLPDGQAIHIDFITLGGDQALVIEFADSVIEAKKYHMEDGNVYFISDMTPEEMFRQMMEEIKNEI